MLQCVTLAAPKEVVHQSEVLQCDSGAEDYLVWWCLQCVSVATWATAYRDRGKRRDANEDRHQGRVKICNLMDCRRISMETDGIKLISHIDAVV